MNFTGAGSIMGLLLFAAATLAAVSGTHAQQGATIEISVKGHHFLPAELHAPANQPLTITVKNLDTTPMEFESVSLRVEKVVTAGADGVVHVRPLAPGRYEFFDDFHQESRAFSSCNDANVVARPIELNTGQGIPRVLVEPSKAA